ncbi:YfkD family protein, partial [Cytobacillus oceanisediminis]|uniref:YfkD family protein n=1 Tax=Cytobacillus oceanisediminis TaxID=665099 RepID=UPI0028D29732
YLYPYPPPINQKPKLTYPQLYLILKPTNKFILLKNLLSQGIPTSIPVHHHLTFAFLSTQRPR